MVVCGQPSYYYVCGQPYRNLASLVLELQWFRGDFRGKAPPLHEDVKMVVERREKIVGRVTLRGGSDGGVAEGVTLEKGSA